jgi:tRNA(fMet)-specific endonuclease VapC
MIVVLDTSVCVELLRGNPRAIAALTARSPDDVALASMTCAELRYGALRAQLRQRAHARLDAFLSAFEILPFDEPSAIHHAAAREALTSTGRTIGERDLVIAATALAHGASVATGNLREFTRVPGLEIENWG